MGLAWRLVSPVGKSGNFLPMQETRVGRGARLLSKCGMQVRRLFLEKMLITNHVSRICVNPLDKLKNCLSQTFDSAVEISLQRSSTSSIPIDILTKPRPKPAAILTCSGMDI